MVCLSESAAGHELKHKAAMSEAEDMVVVIPEREEMKPVLYVARTPRETWRRHKHQDCHVCDPLRSLSAH